MPTARSDFVPVTVGGYFYIAGGCITPQSISGSCSAISAVLERYSFAADSWQTMTPMPRNRTRYNAAAFNNSIYYIGGRDIFDNIVSPIDIYNIPTNSWSTIVLQQPISFSDGWAFAIDSVIYVSSGWTSDYQAIASTFVLNLTTADQQANPTLVSGLVPDRHYAVGDIGGAVIGRRAYLYGGWNATNFCSPQSVLEMYDADNNTWTVLPGSPLGRGDMGIAVIGTNILVSGGEEKSTPCDPTIFAANAHSVPTGDVEQFDTLLQTWAVLTPIAFPRFRFGTVASGTKIYNVGGMTPVTNYTSGLYQGMYFPVVSNVFEKDTAPVNSAFGLTAAGQPPMLFTLITLLLVLSSRQL